MASKPRATGVGGIFIKCEDPDELRQWYHDHLGLNTNQYGALFEFRKSDSPKEKGYLQWSTMSKDSRHFDPSEKEFMVNYRVNDLESMLASMKTNGIEVVSDIQEFEYGKFAHVLDPEGNKVELWEPRDEVFTQMYEGSGETNS